jgi:hypothetical protein
MAINFLNNISVVETAASFDTDKFVVLDSGVLKYRTGAQVRSDIGAGTGSMSSWIIKEGNGTESTSVTNGETFTIAQGTGIQSEMTSTSSGGTITITNTDRGSSQNIFKNFAVSGQSTVVADSNNDTITLATTGFLTITTDATTDTITLNNTITNNNQLTNGAGYITSASLPTVNNGTLTMTTSAGLNGGATFTANQSGNSAFSVSLDLSELTDMTADMTSTDEFIVLDSGAERRKAAGEIGLSIFDNDEGFITSSSLPTVNNATISISPGTDMTGGGTFTTNQGINGTITVNHADTSPLSGTYGSTDDGTKIDQITVDARGHVTAITTGATGSGNGTVTGSGDANYVSKWTSSSAQGNSTIYDNGNVGIGTISPAAKLEVEGGDHLLRLSTTSSTGSPYLSFNQAGTRRSFIQHADSSDTLKLASEYGGIDFYTGTSGTETEKMTIQSDGDVGINVTSPSSKLHVRKAAGPLSSFNSNTIGIYETSGPGYVNIVTGATSTGELWFSDSSEGRGRVRYNHSDDSLQFWVANGEKLRVGVSGQIGIGGANYGSSGQVLTSNGPGSAPSWQAAGGGSNQFASGLYVGGTTATHLLDDYEEGTYTPTLSFSYSGGMYPMTSTLGRYQKIGNTVFVDGYVRIDGFGSGSQSFTFNSVTLPFQVEKNASYAYAVGGTNASWDAYDNDYFCRAKDGTTTLNFPSAANGNDTTSTPSLTLPWSPILNFQIRYRTI